MRVGLDRRHRVRAFHLVVLELDRAEVLGPEGEGARDRRAAARKAQPGPPLVRVEAAPDANRDTGLRQRGLVAVLVPDPSDPAIAFALAPLKDVEFVREELPELHQHDLTVFGHNPTRPKAHVRFPKRTKS